MPHSDFDTNIPGRNSRASDFSNASRGQFHRPAMPRADTLAATPGVLSMLKTSTEIGDVGSLAAPGVRSPAFHSGAHRRHGASSRLSTGSAHSQPSKRVSYHQAFPSVSSAGRRRSITSNLTVPPSLELPPGLVDMSDPTTMPPLPAFLREAGRSYSLTNASHPPPGFPNYRSLTSLRSHEPVQRPRSPYRYPTRLKRPGYRPSSPAMSDVTGQPARPQYPVAAVRPKPVHGPPPAQVGRHPLPYPTLRNRSTPAINIVETLEQKALLFSAPRKPSPALTGNASLSVSTTTRGHTPSDGPPSSDPPSSTPPTPRDVHLGITTTITIADPVVAPLKPPAAPGKGAVYYDYGEDFQEFEKHVTQVYEEITSSPIPMGFVHCIKTLLEERAASVRTSSPTHPSRYSTVEEVTEPDIPELPASPVLKRITREMILAAIAPTSDINDSEHTIKVEQPEDTPAQNCFSPVQPSVAELPANEDDKRKSTLSDPGSITSALTSSTAGFEYALRYAMPHSAGSLQSGMDPFTADEEYNEEVEEITQQDTTQESHIEESPPISSAAPTSPTPAPTGRESAPVPRPGVEIRPATVYICSSSPLVSSSRHSIPTTYTPGQSSRTMETSEYNSDFARQIRSLSEKEKEASITQPAPNIEVERTIVTINVQEMSSPVSPLPEDRTQQISGPMSPVSPLNTIEATPTTSQDSMSATHLSTIWSYRKPVPTYATPATNANDSISFKRNSVESTTGLRFSSCRPNADLLPDLKEESETSLDRASNTFRFPRPGSGAPPVPIDRIRRQRDSLSSKTDSRRDSVFKPHHTHSLSETRAIPSLQFSQINLFAKLNDALESRRTSSMDGYSMFLAPTPERPVQTESGIIREKYRSLFGSLDDDLKHEDGLEPEAQGNSGNELEVGNVLSHPTTVTDTAPTFRPLSPDELIAEVEQISIPNINGLTQRLSEFLPSLKKFYQADGEPVVEEADEGDQILTPKDPVDEAVEVTINEIRSIGKEFENEQANEKSVESKTIETSDSKPNLPRTISAELRPQSTPPEKRPSTPFNPIFEVDGDKTTPLAELEALTPAVLRARSLSDSDLDDPAHYARISNAFRNSLRSFKGSSPAESPPWNLDASYPWANSNLDFDIRLPPPPTLRKDVVKAQPSKLRLRISEDDRESSNDGDTIRPSIHIAMSDAGDHTGSTADTFGHHLHGAHGTRGSKRKGSHGKRSIFGSLSRKIGLHNHGHSVAHGSSLAHPSGIGTSIDTSGFPLSTSLLGDDGRPVDPGDRYPTTGLSPPSAFNIEEVRSFFSDNSSQGDTNAGRGKKRRLGREKSDNNKTAVGSETLKKRLTKWKTSSRTVPRSASALDTQRNPHSLSLSRTDDFFVGGHTVGEERDGEYEHADAMGKTEVRARRFLERIKAFWYRGGEILRTMSMRTTRNTPAAPVEEIGDADMDWEEQLDARHSVEISEEVAEILPEDMNMSVRTMTPHEVQELDHVIEEQIERLVDSGTELIDETVDTLQVLGESGEEAKESQETEM